MYVLEAYGVLKGAGGEGEGEGLFGGKKRGGEEVSVEEEESTKALLDFFSSRRRHTGSLCDWSSDVCSSDLAPLHSSLGDRARLCLKKKKKKCI